VVYGEVTAWTGSQRWAVLSMALFFLVGLLVFQRVDEARGMDSAQGAS
jgi:MFS-type transporter involved in bile tolerance (Atg22 family)